MNDNSISITIDVEDWYHIPSVCGSSFSTYTDVDDFFNKWKDHYDFLTEPTGRILNILDEYNIVATFFTVADVAEHYPGLIESIIDRGHEIACHGLHHQCKIDMRSKRPTMSREEFKDRTSRSKKILSKLYGKNILGYRAPNAIVGGWMLDVLEELGFRYDSSVCVNSLYNKTDSRLEGVMSRPYYPRKNSLDLGGKRDIVEFPWAYYDIGLKIPTGGGPSLRFLGAHMIMKGLSQSLKRGHTVFYFHPIDISGESFPSIGHNRPFYWSIKGDIIEKRLKYILNCIKPIKKICLSDALETLECPI
jgi:peptidoglycan/xylan/chitin deacetylase (PgdA/CDA1 family)